MRARRTASVVVVVSALAFSAAASAEDGVASRAWSDASWREDVVADAALARQTHPSAVERLRALEGLDPDRYLALRRPEPEVARELLRLVERGVVPAALLAELSLELDVDDARYPFSTAERFPKRAAADVERLMAMERAQLRAGLLLTLGDVRYPGAFYLARASLLDEKRALEQRRVAAVALGKTRDARAVALLSRVALDERAPLELRTSALAGLAHVRSLDSVRALEGAVRVGGEPALLRAAALSLGNAGSAWALRAERVTDADAIRARASSALVDLLERSGDAHVTSAVVDALGMVAHAPTSERLRALAADERASAALRERAGHAERRLERALRRAAR